MSGRRRTDRDEEERRLLAAGVRACARGNVADPPLKIRGFQDQETWKGFAYFAIARGRSPQETAKFADRMFAEFDKRRTEE